MMKCRRCKLKVDYATPKGFCVDCVGEICKKNVMSLIQKKGKPYHQWIRGEVKHFEKIAKKKA